MLSTEQIRLLRVGQLLKVTNTKTTYVAPIARIGDITTPNVVGLQTSRHMKFWYDVRDARLSLPEPDEQPTETRSLVDGLLG